MTDENKNNLQGKLLETGYIEIPTEPRLDSKLIGDNDTVGIVYCLICDESIPVNRWEWEGNHSKICKKCKKAILKLRKMFDEE